MFHERVRACAYYAARKRDRMRRPFPDYFCVDIFRGMSLCKKIKNEKKKKPTNQTLRIKKINQASTRWSLAYVFLYKKKQYILKISYFSSKMYFI